MFLLLDGTAYPDTPSVLALHLLCVFFGCHRPTQGPAAGIVNLFNVACQNLRETFCLYVNFNFILTHTYWHAN